MSDFWRSICPRSSFNLFSCASNSATALSSSCLICALTSRTTASSFMIYCMSTTAMLAFSNFSACAGWKASGSITNAETISFASVDFIVPILEAGAELKLEDFTLIIILLQERRGNVDLDRPERRNPVKADADGDTHRRIVRNPRIIIVDLRQRPDVDEAPAENAIFIGQPEREAQFRRADDVGITAKRIARGNIARADTPVCKATEGAPTDIIALRKDHI